MLHDGLVQLLLPTSRGHVRDGAHAAPLWIPHQYHFLACKSAGNWLSWDVVDSYLVVEMVDQSCANMLVDTSDEDSGALCRRDEDVHGL